MSRWVYDVEVFPNLFTATFKNLETKDIKVFVAYEYRNDIQEMEEFLYDEELMLVGFNNLLYDGAILQFAIINQDSDYLTDDLFKFSSIIINSDRFSFSEEIWRYQDPKNAKYKQLDLMKLNAYDKLGVSLKQCSINLKWYRVQDLPYEYNHTVLPEEVNTILDYNLNDVEITEQLYYANLPQIEMREKLSQSYSVDLMSASDSKIANIILEHYYTNAAGVDISSIKNKRTKRDSFLLKDCIALNIKFKSNFFNRILTELSNTVVRKQTDFKVSKTIEFGGVKYIMGVGGLHTGDFPAKFVSDNKYEIVDADVASFYPSMMIVNKIVPEHLDKDAFINILKTITEERLKAKKTDKVKADGLKITINSIFGKLGSETFWLQDARAMLSVTVSGQLYLLMLIEEFVLNGIQVISANTDGVVCRIPKELKTKYIEICEWWQSETAFTLEYTPYDLYVRQDVNNYITKKSDGEVKAKGRFLTKIDLKKGYKYPVVPIAMYNYLLNGIPLDITIRSHQDILDFCMSQKAGKQFRMEFSKNNNIEVLQKNNRFYISLDGGEIYKVNKDKGNKLGIIVDKKVSILNDYVDSLPISKYNIDYQFYIDEAEKFCSDILPYDNYLIPFIDEEAGLVIDYSTQEAKEELLLKLDGIKGLPDKTINGLIKILQEFKGDTFLDLLLYAENNSLISSKYLDLIRINYFRKYGGNKKLEKMFVEFREGKNKFTSKLSEKTKEKRLIELKKLWDSIPDEEYLFTEQMEFDMSILGRFNSTYPTVDKRLVLVEDLSTKYSPKLICRTLKTGKEIEFKVQKKIFEGKKFSEGNVLLCTAVEKKNPVKLIDGKFVEVDGDNVVWLNNYQVIKNPNEILKG